MIANTRILNPYASTPATPTYNRWCPIRYTLLHVVTPISSLYVETCLVVLERRQYYILLHDRRHFDIWDWDLGGHRRL